MSTYTFTCVACGAERAMSYRHGGRRTTCNEACARRIMRQRTREWQAAKKAATVAGRVCAKCGEPIPGSAHANKKYCSDACVKRERADRLAAKRKDAPPRNVRAFGPQGQVCTCPDCGATFVGPVSGRLGKVRWCADCARQGARRCRDNWSQRNPDKVAAAKQRWREANPGYMAEWAAANPERVRELGRQGSQRRRHLKRTNSPSESFDYAEVFERDGWVCGLCGDPVDPTAKWPDDASPTLDHIVPLSRGGAHARNNVQLAHWACNRSKGARASA